LSWQADEYELFFALQRAKPYNQIGIDFNGLYTALRHGEGGPIWDSGVSIISDINASDRWTLYVTLPLEKLVSGGVKPGDTFFMNILRSVARKRIVKAGVGEVAWNPTLGGYHAPRRFGEVTLK